MLLPFGFAGQDSVQDFGLVVSRRPALLVPKPGLYHSLQAIQIPYVSDPSNKRNVWTNYNHDHNTFVIMLSLWYIAVDVYPRIYIEFFIVVNHDRGTICQYI